MSTHQIEVVPVILEPHPNADSLSIVRVYGYTVCVRTEEWVGKDKGIYIPPDFVVPDTPEWAFLKGHRRIRVRRLRGVMSQGMLIPIPDGLDLGMPIMEQLGITRYEPPVDSTITQGAACTPPVGIFPRYDVESWHRYKHVFQEGENVVITEKIHGSSGRWVYQDNKFFAGSRNEWKQENPDVIWWKCMTDELRAYLQAHPSVAVYGEVYGWVQSLRYGAKQGGVSFVAFDILDSGQWLNWPYFTALCSAYHIPRVPILYTGPYLDDVAVKYASGMSTLAFSDSGITDHIREGCVIRPRIERTDLEIGRVQLKVVSDEYLERY